MQPSRARAATFQAWLALAAAALLAMSIGHALQLWLEDMRLFGGSRAGYVHSAQAMCLELAIFGLLLAVYWALRWLLQANSNTKLSIPVLDGILRLGRPRAVALLVAMQFGALIAIELLEQHFSSYAQPGLAAIFGAAHASAILVHLTIGSIIGFIVYAFAAAVSSRSRALATILGTFLRRSRVGDVGTNAAAFRRFHVIPTARSAPLLSLGLANRPPPRRSLA